jgi:hypothetical protein
MTDTKFGVEWNAVTTDERQDAVWYYGLDVVGTARLERDGTTYELEIRCDGETKVQLPYDKTDPTDVRYVRYATDWEEAGVETDAQMLAVTQEWLEQGVDIWIFNSWFDCYAKIDGDWVHLDAVTHTIDDAEAQAEAILLEVAEQGGWSN